MLANYTTTVNVPDTITEIERLLMNFGANQISKQYENGQPMGIEFSVKLDGHPLLFRLPINTTAAHKVLNSYKLRANLKTQAHAQKVSWRILRDWIRVQLAMVELKQAEMAQVFMPYAVIGNQTAYHAFRAGRVKELGAGK